MISFFINRPVLANVLAIVIVLLGAVALVLPVSQYPNIVPPTVQVTANYPGASAKTVVDNVALPIELQVNGVEGMIYMQSYSTDAGTYQLTVTFEIGTDLDFAQVLVQNKGERGAGLAAALGAGPRRHRRRNRPRSCRSWRSPRRTAVRQPLSEQLRQHQPGQRAARLPGVGNVNVLGVGQYSMRVWLDPQKLYTSASRRRTWPTSSSSRASR